MSDKLELVREALDNAHIQIRYLHYLLGKAGTTYYVKPILAEIEEALAALSLPDAVQDNLLAASRSAIFALAHAARDNPLYRSAYDELDLALEKFGPVPPSAAPDVQSVQDATFQTRVQTWMMTCFGETIAGDREERSHRFLEESLELVQACGATQSEAHQLVDYVYGRPVGEKNQEVGGVMVTLAALCLAQGLDMHAAGETELARIWTKVEAIRAKQAAKPKDSPLPMTQDHPEQVLGVVKPVQDEPVGYIDREDLKRLSNYKATIWPGPNEIDAAPLYTSPQLAAKSNDEILKIVHDICATGRIALTATNNDGEEVLTDIAKCFVRALGIPDKEGK